MTTSVDYREATVDQYQGMISNQIFGQAILAQLKNVKHLIAAPSSQVLSQGRNLNIRLPLSLENGQLDVVVKSFGPQHAGQDLIDKIKGSKARRTWQTSLALKARAIGTPNPVAFLERWNGHRLEESYFIAEHVAERVSFKDELVRLFREDPDCEKFMRLLQVVADAVRKMHEAGVQHNDLGNQNILLKRVGDADWENVCFIDLNRARVRSKLSLRARARDISRIYLPSDLLRVFKEMYCDDVPPEAFQKWERVYRQVFALHTFTRPWRHPVREWSQRRQEPDGRDYPSEKDMWIWDKRSVQPIAALKSRDRLRYYPLSRHFAIAGSTLRAIYPVWKLYKQELGRCYQQPVQLKNRIGVAISAEPAGFDREMRLLAGLGKIPVLVRCGHHESETRWNQTIEAVHKLRAVGHPVCVALTQDRQAVKDPDSWKRFINSILDRVGSEVEWVEVGHAINRVKWGIWGFKEYARLLRATAEVLENHPDIRFVGPATIDFEYPFTLTALSKLPRAFRFKALSHHLYVDRRGAPENKQGRFSTLDKFALARAIAGWSGKCDDRVIVSEVNWPLQGTGVYSPVGSPYESPGDRFNDPSVSEDEYADYMIRYLVMAICSGMVDCVMWWRLVARGFGLVDDTDSEAWRERPAYRMLRYFLRELGDSAFIERLMINERVNLLKFERDDGSQICLASCHDGEIDLRLPFTSEGVVDAFGNVVAGSEENVRVGPRPVYIRLK